MFVNRFSFSPVYFLNRLSRGERNRGGNILGQLPQACFICLHGIDKLLIDALI